MTSKPAEKAKPAPKATPESAPATAPARTSAQKGGWQKVTTKHVYDADKQETRSRTELKCETNDCKVIEENACMSISCIH